ncbi:MAG: 50S ribosomal protein L20, partial [Deltaproteobacteria bacterium]|nr:50S ribosomal protein L20 [Deltaproteobacteria bacterium]
YKHRKTKKREFRALWQIRISAALKEMGLSYSRVIHQFTQKGIGVKRKILAELAVTEPNDFKQLVQQMQS